MKYREIDPWCDLFERRLRRGDQVSIDDFLKQNRLPGDDSLVIELQNVESEYRPRQPAPNCSIQLAETVDRPTDPAPTNIVVPPAGSQSRPLSIMTKLKRLFCGLFKAKSSMK